MRRMQTTTLVDGSVPRARPSLEHLSDAELLAGTRHLVGRSNQLLAELLVHLGEVEARGIHRTRACSSLYAYCIYELRFSEDEAFRRVGAARLVRRFPRLLDAVASGELHLTGLLMLGPHLTEANLVEVLARAKHRTKRELARLVRILDPLPAVPSHIEPLGPAPARLVPPEPTWQAFIASTCPVRELAVGDRPRDWFESANDSGQESAEQATRTMGAGVARPGKSEAAAESESGGDSDDVDNSEPDYREYRATVAAPERVDSTTITAQRHHGASLERPERYKVQFTATDEYVRLVDEAKALLSHAVPNATLEELQMRAMRALVAELKKRKYGVVDSSPARGQSSEPSEIRERHATVAPPRTASRTRSEPIDATERTVEQPDADRPEQAVGQDFEQPHADPRRRGRHIPAGVRRTVFERDGNRCTYLDANGTRCAETHRLEFHHLKPFAHGGDHRVSNLTLRCAAHNALAAEEDFGREGVENRKASLLHERFRSFELLVGRVEPALGEAAVREVSRADVLSAPAGAV